MRGALIYVCPYCGGGMTAWQWMMCSDCDAGRYWGRMA